MTRRWRGSATAVVAGLALAMAVPGGAGAAPDASREAVEAEFAADVNALRAERGLAPLPVDVRLVEKARSWAATMAEADDLWHSHLPEGMTADWDRLGENVGRGGDQDALHDAFVASPGHYRNLVDPDWDALGIGVVFAPDGRIYVAEEFMELRSGAVVAPGAPESRERQARPPDAGGPAGASSSPVHAPAGPRVDAAASVTAHLERLAAFAG